METKIEVPFHLGKSIEQARTAKKMTQLDLARALVVQPPIIKQYENGTAIPNNAFIAKIEKTLGVKLPRVKKIKVVE
jgi:putative transcription factor